MKLGTLVHTLVLEPEKFSDEYIVKPGLVTLPKVGLLKDLGREEFDEQKAARSQIEENNKSIMDDFNFYSKGREVITSEVLEEAKQMFLSVTGNELAHSLIADSKVEQSIYFTHEPTGLQCKVRPDSWLNSIVTDLKTSADASYRAFQSSAYKMGYYLQAGMIHQALKSIGIDMEKFVFVCVESKEPYLTATYILDDEALEYGINQFNTIMEQFAIHLEQDRWPAYELRELSLPNYARYED